MDVEDFQRRAHSVIDVGRGMPFGFLRNAKTAGRVLLILALLIGLFTTYYQVNADEVGVVQRFGRYVRTSEPGPHVKLPFLEKVTLVPVQRQLKVEFGFRTRSAGVQS